MAGNVVHLSEGCLIVFLFNTNVPRTPSGVRVPLQHLWVPKALRRELSGRNPAGMFPPHGTSSESCSSSAAGARFTGVRASPAAAPWEFGNSVITNSLFSPPPGASLGAPTAFENEFSNFSNTVWKTNGLVFPYQLTPSKGPRALPWEAPPVPAAGLKAQRIVRYSSPTLQHFVVKKVP